MKNEYYHDRQDSSSSIPLTMINPFSLQSKIRSLQREVLQPLYTQADGQENHEHDWLLVLTGRIIEKNRQFLEELASSSMIAAAFKVVKALGGAAKLAEEDFASFTEYVKEGGLAAMTKMLLAADKEQAFLVELRRLPPHVRVNAPRMLERSATLHQEFISAYFKENFGEKQAVPAKLQDNFNRSDRFIRKLASLAKAEK